MTDLCSSMYAAVGILLALYQREKTGRGQVIDISMFETAASWLGYFPHHYWHRGEEPARFGMRHQYITPYGPYLAGDGKYVGVACASQADWEIFCRDVIHRPELAERSRASRPPRRAAKIAMRSKPSSSRASANIRSAMWLKRLEAARLPYGSVNGVAEVLSHPQMLARNMIREIDSPVGRVPVMATPLHLSDSPQRLDPVPELGGDNEVDPARARLLRVRDRRFHARQGYLVGLAIRRGRDGLIAAVDAARRGLCFELRAARSRCCPPTCRGRNSGTPVVGGGLFCDAAMVSFALTNAFSSAGTVCFAGSPILPSAIAIRPAHGVAVVLEQTRDLVDRRAIDRGSRPFAGPAPR